MQTNELKIKKLKVLITDEIVFITIISHFILQLLLFPLKKNIIVKSVKKRDFSLKNPNYLKVTMAEIL